MNRLDARTGTLAWTDSGAVAGPGLILLHSLGTDSSMWEPQLSAFSAVRRVLRLDLPGHGGSTANAGPYTLDDLGLDVLDVSRAAGLERLDVCGISLGGLIALWLAINAPDQVSTLIACNTGARLGSEALWSERIQTVRAGGMDAIRDVIVTRFFAPGFRGRHPDTFASITRVFTAIDPIGYLGCCAALRDSDLAGSVSLIRCPTLLVGGDQDTAAPPEQTTWLHEHIADSRVEIIAGAGHLSNLDRPDVFTRIVLQALGEPD